MPASGSLREWLVRADVTCIQVLSPHLDDAVFSAFAALTLEFSGDREVCTCFTQPRKDVAEGWAQASGFATPEMEFAARREEDRSALAALGVRATHLGLAGDESSEEMLGRWSDNRRAIGGRRLVLAPGAAGRRAPAGVVQRACARIRRVPVGPMQHPEHLRVRDLALGVQTDRDTILGFYIENPYVWGDRPERVREEINQLLGYPHQLAMEQTDPVRKLRVAELYASQVGPILGADETYRLKIMSIPEFYVLPGRHPERHVRAVA